MTQKAHYAAPPKETFTVAKHRIEGLADGLFAIVMTLLVLDLKVPELEGRVSAQALLHAVGSNWRVFFSLGVTFCLASIFWVLQQRIFGAMRVVDRASLFLSLASLLFASVLPFSTAMLGRYSYNSTATVFYFADQFGIALFVALLWYRTIHTNNLAEMARADQTRMNVRVYALAAACLVAMLAGLFKAEYADLGFIVVVGFSRLYQKRFLHL
jgi:uncharacterized membrane protein